MGTQMDGRWPGFRPMTSAVRAGFVRRHSDAPDSRRVEIRYRLVWRTRADMPERHSASTYSPEEIKNQMVRMREKYPHAIVSYEAVEEFR
jgi:hypothetical protein